LTALKIRLTGILVLILPCLLAKSAQSPPRDLATLISAELGASIFQKVEIAWPGIGIIKALLANWQL
jgi:hypothetical protein